VTYVSYQAISDIPGHEVSLAVVINRISLTILNNSRQVTLLGYDTFVTRLQRCHIDVYHPRKIVLL